MILVMSRSAAWLEVEGLGRLKFGGGAAEGFVVGGPPMMQERDSMASRSVSILSMLGLTTSRSPDQKILAIEPKQERSELTITNRLFMVFNIITWSLLKRQQEQLM